MYKLIVLAVCLLAGQLSAQTNYETEMTNALTLWKSGKAVEAVNTFERISKAEPEKWLPNYYAAQVLIVEGFSIKNNVILKKQLDKAQKFIDSATVISKNNPELLVLQALLYTVYVASDGATYGMLFSGKIATLYGQAYAIAPENPRVVLNKADWGMGSARFFNQDTQPFCKELKKAQELFVTFKPETKLHPNWGRERLNEVLKSCK